MFPQKIDVHLRRIDIFFINSSLSLTDGIDFVHENNTRLMIFRIGEHFSDHARALSNVFIHNGTWHNLGKTNDVREMTIRRNWFSFVLLLKSYNLVDWLLLEPKEFFRCLEGEHRSREAEKRSLTGRTEEKATFRWCDTDTFEQLRIGQR